MKFTAQDILGLLKSKHYKDVFISECKNGGTWNTAGLLKMDAWVMMRSWANPSTIVYEIKVNRSDFVNDNKWLGYLDYCTQFYFVAPPGLIQKAEVPENCGLMEASKNCKQLRIRVKAPYRDIEVPESIYRYILMSRVETRDEYSQQSKAEYWKNWLCEKKENHYIGTSVSKKLKRVVEEQIKTVEKENDRIRNENYELEIVKQAVERLGLDIESISKWNAEEQIKTAMGKLPDRVIEDIENGLSKIRKWNKSLMQGENGENEK